MDNNNQNDFSYTYSAKEQAEIKRIRDKYDSAHNEKEDKMTRLRRLDASVVQRAQMISLIFGVVGTLTLGTGMSLIMTDLAANLGVSADTALILGIAIGVIGGVIASLAYPIYNATLNRMRKKVSPEIIRLTDELMK